ncbi:hypothetical protein RI129_000004 [Pyrocoelia pectoralis]|uniref:Protein kinase domain-containing protein n=1 Tax=Pyrocoelia pectoralis TaxID=417401 RepID=A0AAN7UYC3_9COLE
MSVQHPNCIYIFEILRANNKIYIFMEFANGGDLTTAIEKKGALPESLACYWFWHTSEALAFMHREHKIAHRDIKGDNILIHRGIAKLTDFGFAKYSWDDKNDQAVLAETYCGTEPYYSPQLAMRGAYNPYAADCWAMGVVLFVCIHNKFPFHYGDNQKMLNQMNDPNFLPGRYATPMSKDLQNLQEGLFQLNEKRRMTMAEVLQHPWIKKRGKKD